LTQKLHNDPSEKKRTAGRYPLSDTVVAVDENIFISGKSDKIFLELIIPYFVEEEKNHHKKRRQAGQISPYFVKNKNKRTRKVLENRLSREKCRTIVGKFTQIASASWTLAQ